MSTLKKLSFLPERAGYSYSRDDGVLSVKLRGGLSKSRIDQVNNTSLVDVTWILDSDEFLSFMFFYDTFAMKSVQSFLCDLLLDTPLLEEYECKFVPNTLQSQEPSGRHFTITAQLEVIPTGQNPLTKFISVSAFGDFVGASFDGVSDFYSMGSSLSIAPVRNWAISMFVNPNRPPNANETIFEYRNTTGVGDLLRLFWNEAAGKIGFIDGQSNGVVSIDGWFELNKFTHVVWQRRQTRLEIYVDGVLIRTNPAGLVPPETASWSIGRFSVGGHFSGYIGDVRRYNKSLNLEEVTYFKTLGVSGIKPPDEAVIAQHLNETLILNGEVSAALPDEQFKTSHASGKFVGQMFNGTSDNYELTSEESLIPAGDWGVGLFFLSTRATPAALETIINYRVNDTGNVVRVYNNSNDVDSLPTGSSVLASSWPTDDDTIHHFLFQVVDSAFELYYDGVLIRSGAMSSLPVPTATWLVGSYFNAGYVQGLIGAVRMFQGSLSASEILYYTSFGTDGSRPSQDKIVDGWLDEEIELPV